MSNYYKVRTICPAWMINIQGKRGVHYCTVVLFEDWGNRTLNYKDHATDAKQTHGYIGYLYRRTEIYEDICIMGETNHKMAIERDIHGGVPKSWGYPQRSSILPRKMG